MYLKLRFYKFLPVYFAVNKSKYILSKYQIINKALNVFDLMISIELTKVIKGKYEDTFKYTAMSSSSDEPNQNKLGIFIGGKSKKSKSNSISMFNNIKSNNITMKVM